MSVNSFREDEEQKEVLKLDTLIRLYRYLFRYGKKILLVLLIMYNSNQSGKSAHHRACGKCPHCQ